MKYFKILLSCLALCSSLAFALDGLPYGADSVRIDGGKVNVKGMNGQSVNVDGGNVDVQGMHGQSVKTGGGKVDAKGMHGQSVSVKGKAGKKRSGDEDEDQDDDSDAKEPAAPEEKE